MFDFLKIADKIKGVKAEIEAVRKELSAKEFIAEAGGGMVQVRVRGNHKLASIEIDPQLCKESEKETLQDLIVAATNIAMAQAEEAMQDAIKDRASGLLPQIPGLDISKFF